MFETQNPLYSNFFKSINTFYLNDTILNLVKKLAILINGIICNISLGKKRKNTTHRRRKNSRSFSKFEY